MIGIWFLFRVIILLGGQVFFSGKLACCGHLGMQVVDYLRSSGRSGFSLCSRIYFINVFTCTESC